MYFKSPVHLLHFYFVILIFGEWQNLVTQYLHILRLQDAFSGSVLPFLYV
jgi:hypothetical protein